MKRLLFLLPVCVLALCCAPAQAQEALATEATAQQIYALADLVFYEAHETAHLIADGGVIACLHWALFCVGGLFGAALAD